MEKEQLIVIAGPDHNEAFIKSNFMILKELQGIEVKIIGDGKRDLTEKEILDELAKNPYTKKTVMILSHGSINLDYDGGHSIKISNTETRSIGTETIADALKNNIAPVDVFSESCYGLIGNFSFNKLLKKGDRAVTTAGFDISYSSTNYEKFVEKWNKNNSQNKSLLDNLIQEKISSSSVVPELYITDIKEGTKSLKESIYSNTKNTSKKAPIEDYTTIKKEEFDNKKYNISIDELSLFSSLIKAVKTGNLKETKKILEGNQLDNSFNYIFNDTKSKPEAIARLIGHCNFNIMSYLIEKSKFNSIVDVGLILLNSSDPRELIKLLDKKNIHLEIGNGDKNSFFEYLEIFYTAKYKDQYTDNFITKRDLNYVPGLKFLAKDIAKDIIIDENAVNIIRVFMENGHLNINAVVHIDDSMKSLLEIATTKRSGPEVAMELIKYGADTNTVFSNGKSALCNILENSLLITNKEKLIDEFLTMGVRLGEKELQAFKNYINENDKNILSKLSPHSLCKLENSFTKYGSTFSNELTRIQSVQKEVKKLLSVELVSLKIIQQKVTEMKMPNINTSIMPLTKEKNKEVTKKRIGGIK